MKKAFLFASIFFSIVACKKGDTEVSYSNPVISVTASMDTVWYNGNSIISWSATNASAISVSNGIGSVALSGSFTTPALTQSTTYTFSVTGPTGKKTSKAIRIYVHSERTTLLCNYGQWHLTYLAAKNVDSTNWVIYPTTSFCDTYQFLPNNIGIDTHGPCSVEPGRQFQYSWSFKSNETEMEWGQVWTIDTLNTRKLQRSRINEDIFTPGIFYNAVEAYEHP